jgi:hypothetical protein
LRLLLAVVCRVGFAFAVEVRVTFALGLFVAELVAEAAFPRRDVLLLAVESDLKELLRRFVDEAADFSACLRFRFLSSLMMALINSSFRIECHPAMRFFLASWPSSLEV